MAKKSKQIMINDIQSAAIMQQKYIDELDSNPEFALIADPENKYKMTEENKKFIEHYVNFKNVATAAELAGIDANTARQYFISYNTQLEIRRINRALYHRQFATKLISIDDIAGYLTSLLTGENMPIADQLKSTEKLRVVELLLRLNEMKAASIDDPSRLSSADLSIQIKNLSIATIQQLLKHSKKPDKTDAIISELDDGQLSIEEKAYLQSLSADALLQIIDDTNKQGGNNDN